MRDATSVGQFVTGRAESYVSNLFVQAVIVQLSPEASASVQMRSKDSDKLSRRPEDDHI